jgi:uncharacterized membrane protein
METRGYRRLARVLKWVAISLGSVAVVLIAGLGLVALVAQGGSTDTWSRWSSAGQAFGVLTAVFSGFALAALVITFLMQLQELKAQRTELCQQRELLGQARAALHLSAEAEIRTLHGNLIKLAMDDEDLAEVWPQLVAGLAPGRNRQYLYVNLILQHLWLRFRTSVVTEPQLRSEIAFLFSSPLVRAYWRDTERSRTSHVVPGTEDFHFNEVVAQVANNYAKLARLDGPPPNEMRDEAA